MINDSPLKVIHCENLKDRIDCNGIPFKVKFLYFFLIILIIIGSWMCYSKEMPINYQFDYVEVKCEGPERRLDPYDPVVYEDVYFCFNFM